MLKGSIVALITPFKDDNLDEETYIKLIDYHLKNGTNGVVPGGTTGRVAYTTSRKCEVSTGSAAPAECSRTCRRFARAEAGAQRGP